MTTCVFLHAAVVVSAAALVLACGGRTGDDGLSMAGEPGGGSQGETASGATASTSGSTGVSGCPRGATCATATTFTLPVTSSYRSVSPCVSNGVVHESGESWICDSCGGVCTCTDGAISSTGSECVTSTYTATETSIGSASCYTTGAAVVCVQGSTVGDSSWTTTRTYTYTTTDTAGVGDCYDHGVYLPQGAVWPCADGCNRCQCIDGQVWSTTYDCVVEGGEVEGGEVEGGEGEIVDASLPPK